MTRISCGRWWRGHYVRPAIAWCRRSTARPRWRCWKVVARRSTWPSRIWSCPAYLEAHDLYDAGIPLLRKPFLPSRLLEAVQELLPDAPDYDHPAAENA